MSTSERHCVGYEAHNEENDTKQTFIDENIEGFQFESIAPLPTPHTLDLFSGSTSAAPSVQRPPRASHHNQKIKIEHIEDNRKRQVSFCKRKNGSMKKGAEVRFTPSHFLIPIVTIRSNLIYLPCFVVPLFQAGKLQIHL